MIQTETDLWVILGAVIGALYRLGVSSREIRQTVDDTLKVVS